MIPYICYQNNVPTVIANPVSYCVYFLKSLKTGKTYVGYTSNIYNRIKQHNGYITGGAKRTTKDRPWEIVCIISGFPDSRSALQFEFAWHDARAPRKRIPNGTDGKRRYRKCPHITTCKEGLEHLLCKKWTSTAPEPKSFPLTVIWNTKENCLTYQWLNTKSDYSCWSIFQGSINYNRLIEQVTGIPMYSSAI